MSNDLNPYAIALIVTLIIVQVRFHTSKSTRDWILDRANRFLHAFLMSPVNPRRAAKKETQD